MLSSKAKITYDPRLRFGRTLDGGGALSVQVGFVVCTNFVGSMSGLPFRMCFAVVDVAHALPRGAVGVFSVPRAAGERALLPNIHLGSAVGRHPFLRFWPAAPDVVSDHIDGLRERNKEEEQGRGRGRGTVVGGVRKSNRDHGTNRDRDDGDAGGDTYHLCVSRRETIYVTVRAASVSNDLGARSFIPTTSGNCTYHRFRRHLLPPTLSTIQDISHQVHRSRLP